jgi:hypothetical protein
MLQCPVSMYSVWYATNMTVIRFLAFQRFHSLTYLLTITWKPTTPIALMNHKRTTIEFLYFVHLIKCIGIGVVFLRLDYCIKLDL